MKKTVVITLILLYTLTLTSCSSKKTIAIGDYLEVTSNGSANGYGSVDYKFNWDKLNLDLGQSRIDKAVKKLNPTFYELAKSNNVTFTAMDLLSISNDDTGMLKNGDKVTFDFAQSLQFYGNDVKDILDALNINSVSYTYDVNDLLDSITIDFFKPFNENSIMFVGKEGELTARWSDDLNDCPIYEDNTIKVDFIRLNNYHACARVFKNGQYLTDIMYFGTFDYYQDLKKGDKIDIVLNNNVEILASEGYVPMDRNKTYTVDVIYE